MFFSRSEITFWKLKPGTEMPVQNLKRFAEMVASSGNRICKFYAPSIKKSQVQLKTIVCNQLQ